MGRSSQSRLAAIVACAALATTWFAAPAGAAIPHPTKGTQWTLFFAGTCEVQAIGTKHKWTADLYGDVGTWTYDKVGKSVTEHTTGGGDGGLGFTFVYNKATSRYEGMLNIGGSGYFEPGAAPGC